jgi:hypothetical protein
MTVVSDPIRQPPHLPQLYKHSGEVTGYKSLFWKQRPEAHEGCVRAFE